MAAKVIIFTIILLLIIEWTYCLGAKEIQCKPMPGCHMAHCDPGPPGIANFPSKNGYPITCVRVNPETEEDFFDRQDFDKLADEVTKSRAEAATFKKVTH